MNRHLLVWPHLHPFWPLVLPLNLTYVWYFFCHCPKLACPIHTSNIPGSKSHVYFLVLRSFIHRICPGLRLLLIFCNKLIFLRWGVVNPRPNPHHLSTTAFSIYLQLPSTSGGHLHPQPEDPPNMEYNHNIHADSWGGRKLYQWTSSSTSLSLLVRLRG
jgi:hypothetical protein